LEGLLNQVYEELDASSFAKGDAAAAGTTSRQSGMDSFLANLKKVSLALFASGSSVNVAQPIMT